MSEDARTLDFNEYADMLPALAPDANKYSRGTVAVVGGSAAYPAAPIMAALAAARTGAGYTRLVCPEGVGPAAHAHLLSIPVTTCPQDEYGAFSTASVAAAVAACSKSKAIVVGPGMGAGQAQARFLAGFLSALATREARTLVLDADALNLIAREEEILEGVAGFPKIMTPHEGEAARLLGRKVADRLSDARELAHRFSATVVLKGPRTLTVTPERRAIENENAGPELAKAGTGDVLSGIIGALAAQGSAPADAAALGVYVHGSAGELAAARRGAYAVLPEDIIDDIGIALRDLGA